MNNAFHILVALAVLAVTCRPVVVGFSRQSVDTHLRLAEEGRDPRTGVLLVFDRAYGSHETRVAFAKAGRSQSS
jgi:hypothetical protein